MEDVSLLIADEEDEADVLKDEAGTFTALHYTVCKTQPSIDWLFFTYFHIYLFIHLFILLRLIF